MRTALTGYLKPKESEEKRENSKPHHHHGDTGITGIVTRRLIAGKKNSPSHPYRSVPSPINALMISCFYEAPPSEIDNGLRLVSWLSVLWFTKPPVDIQKRHAPHLSCMYCIVNNGVSILLINLSPIDIRLRILVKRIAQNLCKHTALNGMCFVCCCLILLSVNATAYVSF